MADGGQDRDTRVSLYPLDFEDALRGILHVQNLPGQEDRLDKEEVDGGERRAGTRQSR